LSAFEVLRIPIDLIHSDPVKDVGMENVWKPRVLVE